MSAPGPLYNTIKHLPFKEQVAVVKAALHREKLRVTARFGRRTHWVTFTLKVPQPIETVPSDKEEQQREARLPFPWLTRESAALARMTQERVRSIVDQYNWSRSKPEEDYFNEAIPYTLRIKGSNGEEVVR